MDENFISKLIQEGLLQDLEVVNTFSDEVLSEYEESNNVEVTSAYMLHNEIVIVTAPTEGDERPTTSHRFVVNIRKVSND